MTEKSACAEWEGDLDQGRGKIRCGPGSVEANLEYSYASRFENRDGFSPEDLIAAAVAGCFSMAMAHLISEKKMVPQKIRTFASVSLRGSDTGFTIPGIKLETHVHALGLTQKLVDEYAETARETCPVARLVAGAEISVKTMLEKSLT